MFSQGYVNQIYVPGEGGAELSEASDTTADDTNPTGLHFCNP